MHTVEIYATLVISPQTSAIKRLGMKKLHQDKEFLRQFFSNGHMTSKDLAKELNVSYKLIEIYLAKYEIPFKSQKPSVDL